MIFANTIKIFVCKLRFSNAKCVILGDFVQSKIKSRRVVDFLALALVEADIQIDHAIGQVTQR